MENEKKIDLNKVKGQGTKDTGIAVIVISIILGAGLLFYGLTQLNTYSGRDEAPVFISYGVNVLLSGILVGIVIAALGQIMVNTGTTTLIQRTKSEEEGYKFTEKSHH